ncbi:uncharacterized protein F5891DRAFT_1054417 [Suillus fuscotomentosus]|uniref:C2H2-type domain-containing protein n=1 Tax=Suillus fuscotomentosus TaxID=1912939 RepID=A0AAD4DYA8_9AGAM|nr:uncharacterized protein F5891DRAFT_1054417 [Suillus fuscotomentosus]KAG1896349.1 hypothetical protein F5891DRAFT_1054417 [Suillus fuscotomentosus]
MSCTSDSSSPSPASSPNSNDRSNLSLLSLSVAAASASPISVSKSVDIIVQPLHVSGTNFGPKHRRLSSTGKTRRRLSDARDAATRPLPASLQSTALSSLATLSLSSSPPSSNIHHGTSLNAVSRSILDVPDHITVVQGSDAALQGGSFDDNELSASLPTHSSLGTSGGIAKNGKKRGTIFTCESCSKVYRHPSCLIKHRWEHTPQWREASKFVLSKHQQVQLLEAAAILSHLSPSSTTGTSLPEDRSLWPTFLSGGIVPPPAPGSAHEGSSPSSPSKPISSSVPATSALSSSGRAGSTGPRLHDYSISQATGPGGITQLRPGLLGVPTTPNSRAPSSPVPVPAAPTDADARNLLALGSVSVHSESWGSPTSSSFYGISSLPSASASLSRSGWSHPRSSVRSMSASSHSSDDGELAEVDDIATANMHIHGRVSGTRFRWKSEEEDAVLSFSVPEEVEEEGIGPGMLQKKSQEQWDGMEMDMEMD